MKYSDIIVIHYTVYGIPLCDDMQRRRFEVAKSDKDIVAACKKLYQDFCERYPLSEYPRRYFRITGVCREYVIPLPSFNEMIKGGNDAENS